MPTYRESYEDESVLEPFNPEIPTYGCAEIFALREYVPWPLAGVPFGFADPQDLYGTFIGPQPGHHFVAESRFAAPEPVGVRVDPAEVCRRKDAPAPLLQLLTWLSLERPDTAPEDALFVPTLVWPARLLSVLAWLGSGADVYPARTREPPAYVDLVRMGARAGVLPGGHVDALLQLSLRAVRDASVRLHDACREAGLVDAVRLPAVADGYPPLIADAIRGLSPVPGAPLAGWSVAREFRKGPSARRRYAWGWKAPLEQARALREDAAELLAVLEPVAKSRRVLQVPNGRRWQSEADMSIVRGAAYSEICGRWMGLVAVAARVLLHYVYRVSLVYSDARPDGYRAYLRVGWADALRELAKLPADDFAGFAGALVERAGIPPEWPWYLERELEDVARRNGLGVLARVWGITPKLEDTLDRAGVTNPRVKPRASS